MIGTEFLVSGWGMTVDGVSSSRSPILKAAFVYGIANKECEETFAHVVSLFLFVALLVRLYSFVNKTNY